MRPRFRRPTVMQHRSVALITVATSQSNCIRVSWTADLDAYLFQGIHGRAGGCPAPASRMVAAATA